MKDSTTMPDIRMQPAERPRGLGTNRRGTPRRCGSGLGRCAAGLALVLLAAGLPGCSLVTMAGKMIFGDPVIPCAFTSMTRVDLAKEGKTVVVVCSTPEAVKSDFPSLNIDLLDGVARQLKRREIKVVSPDDVAAWMDDNGGRWDDVGELADYFQADYIIHIDLDRFTYREENSPDLFRGRAMGNIVAHAVGNVNGQKVTRHVFEREFTSEYPSHHPVSATTVSGKTFRKQYVDRVTNEIAHMFYNHRLSEEIY